MSAQQPVSQTKPLTPLEKKRRADLYARCTYATIMLVFLTIVIVAVTTTMAHEKNKTTFKAIQLSKPISYFDYTYVDESKAPPSEKSSETR